MSDIKLSICIPTYNFGKFIGQTLDSILVQRCDEVEIVIGDGHSTDNTEEIVKDYQSRFSNIRYYKFEKKGGIDVDLIRTLEMARGEYCWLLSSDDVLQAGAIEKLFNHLNSQCTIFLCNRLECDEELTNHSAQLWLSKEYQDQIFNFSNKNELLSYLNASQSLGALFSFMSSIIVRRSAWLDIESTQCPLGSNYAHVFRLFLIALKGGLVKYIREPLILARFGNDSFMEHGLARRFLIDLNGYKLLVDQLFRDIELSNKFKSIMRREHKWYRLTSLAYKVQLDNEWSKLLEGFYFFGYSPFILAASRKIGRSKMYGYLHSRWKRR